MDFIRATLQIMLFRFRFLSQRSNDANELARAILQHSQITCISCKCAPIRTRVLHSDILFYRVSLIPILPECEINSSGAVRFLTCTVKQMYLISLIFFYLFVVLHSFKRELKRFQTILRHSSSNRYDMERKLQTNRTANPYKFIAS